MKRFQLLIAGVFIAAGSLCAQTPETEWKEGVSKIKGLITSNPAQASQEAETLLKGKNKKNVDLIAAISEAYLSAGKISEAETYLELGKKANNKSAVLSVLTGDIAVARKEPGVACQSYEQAIYYDAKCVEAYIKFADVYKTASPQLAIEKLEQLKEMNIDNAAADKKLAEIYYLNNKFAKAAEAYERFVNTPEATEDDIMKYAFALFLTKNFDKSLEVTKMGLQRNPRRAAFNRLAMYNYTDMKRYDEATKAADAFFNASDKADFSYLDYMYYGHLLSATGKFAESIPQYEKAMELDPERVELWREISSAYEQQNDYPNAIGAYEKYYGSLPADKQTADLQFQIGKLYYAEGTSTDSIAVTPAMRAVALASADSVFAAIAIQSPDSYMGNFWRARTNSALDPETTQGLAKPYYELVAELLISKNDPRYNSALIECYSYLGYYYLVANKMPESKEYWSKILAIDPENATAKRALEGIK